MVVSKITWNYTSVRIRERLVFFFVKNVSIIFPKAIKLFILICCCDITDIQNRKSNTGKDNTMEPLFQDGEKLWH